jgi:hypothetical protein
MGKVCLDHSVVRYKEKGVTTVTQTGGCVYHFRVSEAKSSQLQAQSGLYAEKA